MSDKIIPFDKKRRERLGDVKSLDFGSMTQDEFGSGVWDAEIKAFLESTTLKGLFFNEDWVFMLLDIIADHVSMSPMIIKKVVSEKDGKVVEETVDEHPALTLLDNPNPFQEYAAWMYNYVIEYDLMGNALVYYARARQDLFIVPAETANLSFDTKGRFNGYNILQVGVDGSGIAMEDSNQMFFKKDLIWHQRRPNPKSLLWGLSPFVPNRKSILFNRYTQDWLNSFYLKGATPTVALSMEKNVSEESALRFLRSFEVAYTGRRNMRRPLIMPKGVSVETLSPSVADQQLVDLIDKNREQILNILRVPKHAVSLAESGSLGSEEHKQALKFFYSSAVIPTQKKIQEHLTRKFMEANLLEEGERLEFDNSEVEVLREDMAKKAELSQSLLGIFTLNEIRTEIWDKEGVDGGDSVQAATPPPGDPFGGLFGGKKLPDPKPVEDVDVEVEDKSADELGENKYIDELEPQCKDFREAVVKAVIGKYSDHLAYAAKAQFETLEDPLKDTQKWWEDTLVKWGEKAARIAKKELAKASPQQKATDDDEAPSKVPSKKRLRKMIEKALDGDNTKWLDQYVESFNDVLNEAYDLQIDPVAKGENREAIEAIKDRTADQRRSLLAARGIESFKNIRKSRTEQIMNIVEREIGKKTSLDGIAGKITDTFKEISEDRAKTIARTEALTAVSVGKAAAMENAKEVIGEENLVKVWINLQDDRVRGNPGGLYPNTKADHWTLQGEVKDLDEPFSNGLQYPRDLNADSPGEVINCRCDFLTVARDDFENLQP